MNDSKMCGKYLRCVDVVRTVVARGEAENVPKKGENCYAVQGKTGASHKDPQDDAFADQGAHDAGETNHYSSISKRAHTKRYGRCLCKNFTRPRRSMRSKVIMLQGIAIVTQPAIKAIA